MSVQLSILFYIKKSKANLQGYTNIYLRIILDGKWDECSINRKAHNDLWNGRSQKALGNSPENQEINRKIELIRNKIYTIEQKFQRDGIAYSAIQLRDVYLGKNKKDAFGNL